MPKVSVIIPTYNRASLLKQAIQSVLNQTYQNFEIIVIDDASTDNTKKTIQSFDSKKITYICHEKNKGGSAARNTGIKLAKGEYMAFLDSDDEWLPKKLFKQLELFAKSSQGVGVVYTGFTKIDNIKNISKSVMPKKHGRIYHLLLLKNYVGTTSTPLLKRECIEKVGLFDENLPSAQDWDMWIRISKYFNFKYIPKPLVKYNIHQLTISKNYKSVIKGTKIIIKKHILPRLNISNSQNKLYIFLALIISIGRIIKYSLKNLLTKKERTC